MVEVKHCLICGKEITEPYRYHFCSEECRLEANRRRNRKGKKLPPLKEVECPICHKTFKQVQQGQRICSPECRSKALYRLKFIKGQIKDIAGRFDFDVRNRDEIVEAKLHLFANTNMRLCPNDPDNPKRYCGSALCIHDVVHDGCCKCKLFWYKEKPLGEKND